MDEAETHTTYYALALALLDADDGEGNPAALIAAVARQYAHLREDDLVRLITVLAAFTAALTDLTPVRVLGALSSEAPTDNEWQSGVRETLMGYLEETSGAQD